MMKNELIERYVYDVVRRLPEKQRQDIKDELITLIEDMLEERMGGGKSEKENVESVLRELGSPATLADKYRGEKQYLIGGEYYDTYIQVLKIVLICVAAGLLVAAGVSFCVHSLVPNMQVDGLINVMEEGIASIAAIPGACLQAFAVLTLVFAVMERKQVKLNDKVDWKLEELPTIPEKKALISRTDSIVNIVFTVFGLILFTCVPNLLGAWVASSKGVVVAVPIFNMDVWNTTLIMLVIGLIANLVDKVVKLLMGRYCLTVLWTNIVTNLVNVIVAVKMLADPHVWNSHFWAQLAEVTGKTIPGMGELVGPEVFVNPGLGLNALNVVLVIVIFASLGEIVETVYRTFRYGYKK